MVYKLDHIKISTFKYSTITHTCNPRTWEVKAEESGIQGRAWTTIKESVLSFSIYVQAVSGQA